MNPMRALRQYQKVNSHAQISEANPHRLVQMLMEGGLDRMAQAKGALARGDIAQKGLMLGKAVDIIVGLRDGLDAEKSDDKAYVQQLEGLYVYMTNRLMEANQHNDADMIDEVARLLITVKEGWDAIATQ
ncbi:flagellar export chaperone FliS [Pseudomonas sp. ADAK18]|uniref:flagellar export chaperone FliS n=1 Tax=Pseudomonas sp. ADAK18 TaxID=2730848 RepID=UPI0014646864|nr:flagellar export chaperone FliS [Pseudomonas sp. ADAK18]QJI27931.1 flagellar export chaperone FliS [Pseudomonas sp. ADAK18]